MATSKQTSSLKPDSTDPEEVNNSANSTFGQLDAACGGDLCMAMAHNVGDDVMQTCHDQMSRKSLGAIAGLLTVLLLLSGCTPAVEEIEPPAPMPISVYINTDDATVSARPITVRNSPSAAACMKYAVVGDAINNPCYILWQEGQSYCWRRIPAAYADYWDDIPEGATVNLPSSYTLWTEHHTMSMKQRRGGEDKVLTGREVDQRRCPSLLCGYQAAIYHVVQYDGTLVTKALSGTFYFTEL